MTKLTVIEGGGPPDHEAERARSALRMVIVEALRALARGDDRDRRIVKYLADFMEHAPAMMASASSIVDDVISEMSKSIASDDGDDVHAEIDDIVTSALFVAAEVCCDDGLAKARASKRMRDLRQDIETHIVGRETRSRASGWSFLQSLIKNNFPARSRSRPTPKL
jgi:hypothetical protein